jgi:hypothetical protein
MSDTSNKPLPAGPPRRFSDQLSQCSSLLVLLALLLCVTATQAEGPDTQYLPIFNSIQEADALEAKGQTSQALTKYQDAQRKLLTFKRTYPEWNAKMISFRSKYVADQVVALSEKLSAPAAGTTNNTESAPPQAKPALSSAVKLLDPGAEPRQVLRLHPKPGDKQTVVMTIKISIEVKVGEMDAPAMVMPGMKMTIDTTVKSVSPNGEISYDLVVSDAVISEETGVMPQMLEAMKPVMGALKGMAGKGVVSNRGFNKSLQLKPPAGVDPQMRQMLDQMTDSFAQMWHPLPEEAVGAGAKWESRMPIKSEGMTIDQTATYHLATLESERLAVKATVIHRAANQKVQNPAMPTMKMDVTKLTGTGKAEFTMELGQLLPAPSDAELQSERQMVMKMGDQDQAMSMKSDVKVQIAPK